MKKDAKLIKLTKRVDRQEEVIAQLIKIIAATNHRMTQLIEKDIQEQESEFIN